MDARDAIALARFWARALGWRLTHQSDDECVLEPPARSAQDGVAQDLLTAISRSNESARSTIPVGHGSIAESWPGFS